MFDIKDVKSITFDGEALGTRGTRYLRIYAKEGRRTLHVHDKSKKKVFENKIKDGTEMLSDLLQVGVASAAVIYMAYLIYTNNRNWEEGHGGDNYNIGRQRRAGAADEAVPPRRRPAADRDQQQHCMQCGRADRAYQLRRRICGHSYHESCVRPADMCPACVAQFEDW